MVKAETGKMVNLTKRLKRYPTTIKKIFVLLLASSALTSEAAIPEIETVWQKDELIVPTSDAATSSEVTFPAVPKVKGKKVCISFSAFIRRDVPEGWNHYLAISINDMNIGKDCPGGNRIINKADFFESEYGKISYWRKKCGKSILLTAFGDGNAVDKRIKKMTSPEIYSYILDVSDAISYQETGADNRILNDIPNRMIFTNFLLKRSIKGSSYPLVIKNIKVGYLPESVVKELQKIELFKVKGDDVLFKTDSGKYSFEVTPSGGITIIQNGFKWFINSDFSYSREKIGWYGFSVDVPQEKNGWQVVVLKEKPDSFVISGVAGNLKIVRSVRLMPDRIKVTDKIVNTGDSVTGSIIKNTLISEKEAFRHYLSGADGLECFKNGSAENPTVFVMSEKDSGVGVVAEDSVSRCHLVLSAYANTFTMEDPYFSLGPGKAYERNWTIYLVGKGDYWSFINKVRSDWNVNFTVLGPFEFGQPDLKNERASFLYVADWKNSGWFEYIFDGINISREKYREATVQRNAIIKQQLPWTKSLAKLETSLYTIIPGDVVGGQILPMTFPELSDPRAVYGLSLSREQTALLENLPIADSVVRSSPGAMMADTFYAKKSMNLFIYPEKGNYAYKRMLEQIDFLIDDVGLDGIYMDMFSLGWSSPTSIERRSFHQWDGYSAVIDIETGKILKLYTDCSLVGAAGRAEILKAIIAKGKIAVCNTHPSVRETQDIPAMRFIEGDASDMALKRYADVKPPMYEHMAKAHLASPVMLGIRPAHPATDWPKWEKEYGKAFYKGVIAGLRNGLLYYYYNKSIPGKWKPAVGSGPIDHMFPFTPVEINEGFLIGKERIITCVSGKYFWPGKEKPSCFLFDEYGKDKKNDFSVSSKDNGWEVVVKLDDWNEIAVIEAANEKGLVK